MFKKITGLVLGIALFTMCPLTAAAAPMVPGAVYGGSAGRFIPRGSRRGFFLSC